ncbi:MAG: type III pantothenate kinase [Prolixibacteraceae bacterium]|nr:type III pantothenate kinase [Prolixibacteraceae bacterium]
MNLVVDIGNSRTKLAIFLKKELIDSWTVDELKIGRLEEIKKNYPDLRRAILSSVSTTDPEVISYLKSGFSYFLELNYLTPVPINNQYKSPQTLGLDRLAAAIGARELFPGKDLLVIDAGTAVTLDLIESNGTFLGGNISPGLQSRFRALHEFTRNLPLIAEKGEYLEIGQTSEEAIRSGVINGMVFEMDGSIDLFRKKRPGLQPLLTGGDALFFERRLKNAIFVKFEITLIGLNRILEYNVENQ